MRERTHVYFNKSETGANTSLLETLKQHTSLLETLKQH